MFKNLITLGVLTVITIIFWIGFDVYHNSVTSTVTEDTAKTIIPITPTFDSNAIEIIQERNQIPVDLSGGPQVGTVSAQAPTPTRIPTPTQAQILPATTINPSPSIATSSAQPTLIP